eukprot:2808662-Rhodomonas_salina.1
MALAGNVESLTPVTLMPDPGNVTGSAEKGVDARWASCAWKPHTRDVSTVCRMEAAYPVCRPV